MKKIISLMMAILFVLLSCALLCSCDKINPLELEGYSKIDEDDFEIIAGYYTSISNFGSEYSPIPSRTLKEQIDLVKEKDYTFYEISIENPYYICGYINPIAKTLLFFTSGIKFDNVEWYKVENKDQIKDEINGTRLLATYLVYNANVEKDIVNNIELSKKSKFHFWLEDKNYVDDAILKLNANEHILTFGKEKIINDNKTIFFESHDANDSYPICVDESQNSFVLLRSSISFVNGNSSGNMLPLIFGDYYEAFSPYLIYNDIWNEKRYLDENGNYILNSSQIDGTRYETVINVGININDFVDLIIK